MAHPRLGRAILFRVKEMSTYQAPRGRPRFLRHLTLPNWEHSLKAARGESPQLPCRLHSVLCLLANPFLYQPLRIGPLWYLIVHATPPYRWQRCQAILYPNMLLLSWIAQGAGRGIVTLDLLNCTEVRSVASPTHPSSQDDVATKVQTVNAQAEGSGD